MTEAQQIPPTPLHPLSVDGASSFGSCGNCGASLAGPFCSHCGERRLSAEDYSIKSVAGEIAEDFAHFDSKILRTLRALLTQPGLLSKAYFGGGRSRYTKPLTLFVVLNLLFFVIQPHTGLLQYRYPQYVYEGNSGSAHHVKLIRSKLLATREPEADYAIRFNARLQEQKKSMLIFSVPMLALAMALVYFRKGRYYVEHLIFSIHVYAFLLIALLALVAVMLIVINILYWIFGPSFSAVAKGMEGELGISLLIGSALATYIYLGLRRAYSDTRTGALIRAVFLTLVVMLLTGVYHDVLFYATYFTT